MNLICWNKPEHADPTRESNPGWEAQGDRANCYTAMPPHSNSHKTKQTFTQTAPSEELLYINGSFGLKVLAVYNLARYNTPLFSNHLF